MFKNTQKKLLLRMGVGIGIVILLFVINLVIGKDIANRLASLGVLKGELVFRQRAIESLVTLTNDSRRAEPYGNTLRGLLPAQDQVVGVQKNIRDLARENDLGFQFNFGAATLPEQGSPGSITFQLTATGGFSEFLTFLKSIEQSSFFIGNHWVQINFSKTEVDTIVKGRVFSR